MKYHTYEVHTKSPTGLVHTHTVRATSAERAERMVGAGLREERKIIGVVHQFNLKASDIYANRID